MYQLILKYGIGNILKSGELLSLVIGFLILPKLIVNVNLVIELIRGYSTIIIAISIIMLALTVTLLHKIIICIMDNKFVEYIKKSNSYYQFVVPFYLNSLFWIIAVITNIFIFTNSDYLINCKTLNTYILSFSLSLFIACLIGFTDLMVTYIKLVEYKIKSIKLND